MSWKIGLIKLVAKSGYKVGLQGWVTKLCYKRRLEKVGCKVWVTKLGYKIGLQNWVIKLGYKIEL